MNSTNYAQAVRSTRQVCIYGERTLIPIKIPHLGKISILSYEGYSVVPGVILRNLGVNAQGKSGHEIRTIPKRYTRIRGKIEEALHGIGLTGPVDFWSDQKEDYQGFKPEEFKLESGIPNWGRKNKNR